MKKITQSILTIVLVVVMQILPMESWATNIDENTARQYSRYYMSVMIGKSEVPLSQVNLAYTFMNDELNIPAAYVFNVGEQGFVIISGSDLWYPILGYSTEDLFDVNRMPPAMKEYMEGLCEYIRYSQNTSEILISDVEKEWNELQYKTLHKSGTPKTSTWLLNSEWGQGNTYNPTYNKFCPYREIDGVTRTAITGCVATAMSQIMNYWEYPAEPVEDILRYAGCMIDDTVLFGDIEVNLKNVTYNFDTMPNKLTSTSTISEIDAVALLCYHAGVSVRMGYGIEGSGAFSGNVPAALCNVFLYDTAAVYEERDGYSQSYSNDEWVLMLTDEIVANRPVYYSGGSCDSNGNYVGGHAFVCDGYNAADSNKFHFNWGWNGYLNMWCDVRNNVINVSNMDFSYKQTMIRYIQPRPAPTCEDPVIGTIIEDCDFTTFTWTGGAINYQILYKEVAATDWSDTIVSVRHNCTLTNLIPETDYMVKIRALCNSGVGHSDWIDTTFTTTEYVCYTPTNMEISVNAEEGSCNIGWDSRASRWMVNIFTDNMNRIDTITWNPVVYTGLYEGTFHVAVKSMCDENVTSEWSDTATFMVGTNLGVTNISSITTDYESATVAWEGSAINYQLLYKEVSASTWNDTIVTSQNFYTFTDLLPETDYMMRIRALCISTDEYLEWVDTTFSTIAVPCFVPTDVVVADIAYENVSIDWNSEGLTTRWIFNISNDTQNYTDTVDYKPISINGLSVGTEYYVTVKSLCNEDETSDWSETITFTTLSCSEVTDIVASEITTNTAKITWNSPNAVKWELCMGIGISQGEGEILELDGKSYNVSGLQPGTTYDVYVRLYCTDNAYGEWSEKYTFTTEVEPQGIDGIDSEANLMIYPNPTNGFTTISLDGIEGKIVISVVDINGRIVANEEIECGSDCEKRLDVTGLVPGTYFVKVYGDTINSVRKLIVQ